jgi:hypothetical protein
MATVRITKRTVDAARPKSADSYLWDGELSGFGLKVTSAGTKTYLSSIDLVAARGARAASRLAGTAF